MNDNTAPAGRKRSGLLESALVKLFARKARIVQIEDIGRHFRLVTLAGDALRGVGWTPGDKIQIFLGGWVQRTYTPMEWDVDAGRTRVLVYLHSGGPGAEWARALQADDECDVFGPRSSLAVGGEHAAGIVLGDETSIGLAYSLRQRSSRSSVRCLLEVSSVADSREMLARLGLDDFELFDRTEDEAHLEQMLRRLAPMPDGARLILTGRAPFIQRMRRAVKSLGVPASHILAKPYWAPGKTGLD